MRSYKNLWSKFISFDNLIDAFYKARKLKTHKQSIQRYTYDLETYIFRLQQELESDSFNVGKYHKFKIYEPKERIIKSLPFKDRVVQHALINVIESIFDKSFIYDSYACRKGKGASLGINRIKIALKNQFKEGGYCLKGDIKKYFSSVDQNVLKEIIIKKIKDKRLLNIIYKIIDSDHSEFGITKGIPIGNLTSQLFANIYLNELDQFVKNKLNIKLYFRYMDDFIILSNSKKELRQYLNLINYFISNSLKLEMPYRKRTIFRIKDGVDFIGYKFFSRYIRLRRKNLMRFIKRTEKRIKQNNNQLLISSINSWFGYSLQANTINLNKIIFETNFKEYNYLLNKQLNKIASY